MSNLLQEIEAQISGVKTSVNKQNVGIVRECSDGVAKIEGLTDAMANEMLDFGNGVIGLALNLEETEVGAIILGDYLSVHEGSEVKTTGKLGEVVKLPTAGVVKTPMLVLVGLGDYGGRPSRIPDAMREAIAAFEGLGAGAG
jgi:F0F1-type ATP synthase alpha subunit